MPVPTVLVAACTWPSTLKLGARQSWRAFCLPERNGRNVWIKNRADD